MQRFFGPGLPRNPRSPGKIARHIKASCKGKFPYQSEADAQYRVGQINESPDRLHVVHAYRCLYCPSIHVGRMRNTYRVEGVRLRLELEPELGERVTGCIMAENSTSMKKRRTSIVQRYWSHLRKIGRP